MVARIGFKRMSSSAASPYLMAFPSIDKMLIASILSIEAQDPVYNKHYYTPLETKVSGYVLPGEGGDAVLYEQSGGSFLRIFSSESVSARGFITSISLDVGGSGWRRFEITARTTNWCGPELTFPIQTRDDVTPIFYAFAHGGVQQPRLYGSIARGACIRVQSTDGDLTRYSEVEFTKDYAGSFFVNTFDASDVFAATIEGCSNQSNNFDSRGMEDWLLISQSDERLPPLSISGDFNLSAYPRNKISDLYILFADRVKGFPVP